MCEAQEPIRVLPAPPPPTPPRNGRGPLMFDLSANHRLGAGDIATSMNETVLLLAELR